MTKPKHDRTKIFREKLKAPGNEEKLERYRELCRKYSKEYRERIYNDPVKLQVLRRRKAEQTRECRRRNKLRETGKPVKEYKKRTQNQKNVQKKKQVKNATKCDTIKTFSVQNVHEIYEEPVIKSELTKGNVVIQAWTLESGFELTEIKPDPEETLLKAETDIEIGQKAETDYEVTFDELGEPTKDLEGISANLTSSSTPDDESQKRRRKKVDFLQKYGYLDALKPRKKFTRTIRCVTCKTFIKTLTTYKPARQMSKSVFECVKCHDKKKQIRPQVQHSCDICGEVRLSKKSIESHVERHLNLTCDVCQQPYISQLALRRHLLRHIDSFCCEECGRQFSCKVEFQKHIEKHKEVEAGGGRLEARRFTAEDKTVPCSFCPNKFKSQLTLTEHVRRKHSRCHAYKCGSFEKKFNTREELRVHSFEHFTGKIKYCEYPECRKPFKTTKLLTIHRKTHMSVNYECKDCGQKFFTKNGRWKHYKNKSCLKYKLINGTSSYPLETDPQAKEIALRQLDELESKSKQKATHVTESDEKNCEVNYEPSRRTFGSYRETSDIQELYLKNSGENSEPSEIQSQSVKIEPEFFEVEVKEEPAEYNEDNFQFTGETSQENIQIKEEIIEDPQMLPENAFSISEISLEPKTIVKCFVCQRVSLEGNVGKIGEKFMCSQCQGVKIKNIIKCLICKSLMFQETSISVCNKCIEMNPVVTLTRLDPREVMAWNRKRQKQGGNNSLLDKERYFYCDWCGKTFKKHRLPKHFERHLENDRPMRCEFCGETSKNQKILRQHMRTIHNSRAFTCHICGKSCKFKYFLGKHLLIHNKPTKCDICGKMVTDIKGHLYQHKNRDAGVGYSPCPTCGKLFPACRIETHINVVHLKVSLGVSYDCDGCEEKFTRRDDLRRHKLLVHQNKFFECNQCDRVFKSRKTLRIHRYFHNPLSIQCKICDRVFAWKSSLFKHMRLKHREVNDQNEEHESLQFMICKIKFYNRYRYSKKSPIRNDFHN